MTVAKEFKGTLRSEIRVLQVLIEENSTIVTGYKVEVKWREPETREVIWTETCEVPCDRAFASQVVCNGEYKIDLDTHFIDERGKRHFNMHCEVGQLGCELNI